MATQKSPTAYSSSFCAITFALDANKMLHAGNVFLVSFFEGGPVLQDHYGSAHYDH